MSNDFKFISQSTTIVKPSNKDYYVVLCQFNNGKIGTYVYSKKELSECICHIIEVANKDFLIKR